MRITVFCVVTPPEGLRKTMRLIKLQTIKMVFFTNSLFLRVAVINVYSYVGMTLEKNVSSLKTTLRNFTAGVRFSEKGS